MSTPTRFEPKAGLPAVVTDLPITEDQALRVAKMVYGNQSFDGSGKPPCHIAHGAARHGT